MPDPINPSRPETGLPMPPTDTGVSEELEIIATVAYHSNAENYPIRAVIAAIAPRLKAEGMREAAEITRSYGRYTDGTIHPTMEMIAKAIEARADALSPPVKETVRYDGQYPSEDPNWRKGRTESGGDI